MTNKTRPTLYAHNFVLEDSVMQNDYINMFKKKIIAKLKV